MNEILFSINENDIGADYSNKELEKKIISFIKSDHSLKKIPIRDIIYIFNALSVNWQKPSSNLYNLFKKNNFGFLIGWLKQNNIKEILKLNLVNYEALDEPKIFDKKRIFAAPKGVIIHWISGNVPLLGVLSLFQGLLTKNKNIVKVPLEFKNVLTLILNDLSKKTFKIGRRIIHGYEITSSILVVYVDKNNKSGQSILSKYADVRYAWGGKEAIENIMGLDKKIDCEDIIMGPKISLGVISKSFLDNHEISENLATKITRDVFNFDQLGCNSPHNIYIEKNSKISVNQFSEILFKKFQIESKKKKLINRYPIDTYNILSERVFYGTSNDRDVLFDDDYQFSIFIDYNNLNSSVPLYNRSIYLKLIDSIEDAPNYFPSGVQTIGTAVSGKYKKSFIEKAINKGALRFTEIGKMGIYDSPWDGILSINRMVKWISIPY